MTEETRSFVEDARRAKLDELRAAGIEPFGYSFKRTFTAASAVAAYDDTMGDDGPAVAVAGRLVSYRRQGKSQAKHLMSLIRHPCSSEDRATGGVTVIPAVGDQRRSRLAMCPTTPC